MKTECERCQSALTEDGVAYICSFECTYCPSCVAEVEICPNCSGELLPRPRRNLTADGPSMTAKRIAAFNEAWARADVEALVEFITDDCVYAASVGPEPGRTYEGRDAVELGFREMLAYEDGGEAKSGPLRIYGDRALSEWSYTQTAPNGHEVEVRGVDLFEFEGRSIRRKDAFIKTFPLPSVDA